MITDEQISIVADILSQGFSDNDARVRKALEAYEASKWVKFDVDDSTTYPPNSNHVIVLYHSGAVSCDGWVKGLMTWKYAGCINCVTHWQYLPKFKG